MKRLLLSTILLAMAGTTYADIQAPPASEYTATRKLGRAISNVLWRRNPHHHDSLDQR